MSEHPFKEIPVVKPELLAIYRAHGEAKIRDTILKFYRTMSQDVLIGFFFDGKDLEHVAHRQGDFILRAMGATSSYSGKAPADAHANLPPILSGHFDRRLTILEATLRQEGFAENEIRAWLGLENAFRDAVVSS